MLKVKVDSTNENPVPEINGPYINANPGVYVHTLYPTKYRFVITPYTKFMVEMDSGNIMKISELWFNPAQKYVKTAEKLTLTFENNP